MRPVNDLSNIVSAKAAESTLDVSIYCRGFRKWVVGVHPLLDGAVVFEVVDVGVVEEHGD